MGLTCSQAVCYQLCATDVSQEYEYFRPDMLETPVDVLKAEALKPPHIYQESPLPNLVRMHSPLSGRRAMKRLELPSAPIRSEVVGTSGCCGSERPPCPPGAPCKRPLLWVSMAMAIGCSGGIACMFLLQVCTLVDWQAWGSAQDALDAFSQGGGDSRRGGGATSAVSQGAQPSRLRVTNGCSRSALWLQAVGGNASAASLIQRPTKVGPQTFVDVNVTSERHSVQYWPASSCWGQGRYCNSKEGQSSGSQGRMKLEDFSSRFRATFGALGKPCNTKAGQLEGCDFVDVSLHRGFSAPFKLLVKGDCRKPLAEGSEEVRVVDCSALTMSGCPAKEVLGPETVDLNVVETRWGHSRQVGCQSPCSRLSQAGPGALHGVDLQEYCCTDDSRRCREGHAGRSSYAQKVQDMCPDAAVGGMGTGTCPAGTQYEMVFLCPDDQGSGDEPEP